MPRARIENVRTDLCPQNGLLYLKSYPDVADTALPNRPDGDQGMQEVIYNSLDVIEERVASIKSTNPKDVDNYIGCLAVVGALSLFGLVTNTRQKLVIIVKSGKGVPESKEAAVRVLLRKLHVAVVTALLNPFESMDAPIKSSRFDAHVDDIARRYG